ncbi:protein gamma response 1 [Morus notabilis]|uniref:protein gamma response 1 n=1 Tax=Morus notabilis TaxID=981085 RepID=UPI000CED1B6F|nr:protein gamma response 1 [Morus notabilis]
MEEQLQNSPKLGSPTENDDLKYVSGLSTILVATIQEAKDRISQIEYIFCSQLYPNFQSKTKLMQKVSEARDRALYISQHKRHQKPKPKVLQRERETERCTSPGLVPYWLPQFRKQKTESLKLNTYFYPNFQSKTKLVQKVSEARRAADIEWKEKESDLLFQIERLNLEKQQTLEENQSLKLEKARSAKEQEDKNCELLARLESKQRKVEKLELNLQQKSKEVDEGMKLRNSLLELIQLKASETVNKEKQLKEYEEKTDVLLSELHHLEKKVDELQEELRQKIGEVDKGNEIKANLFRKIESQALEILNNEQLLRDQETEKKVLAGKLECLEGAVCNL